jgi:hypothetical protein
MEYQQDNVFSNFPNSIGSSIETVTPTYDQITIKPPERSKTHGKRTKRLIIDSRERDTELHPDPSKYLLQLENEYKDVISIELSQANIPHSFYNIYHDEGKSGVLYANNIIYLHLLTTDGDKSRTFELPPGKYRDIASFSTGIVSLFGDISVYMQQYLTLSDIKLPELTSKFEFNIVPTNPDFSKVISFYFDFIDPNTCPILNPNVQEKKEYPKHSIGPILGFNKKNVGVLSGTVSIAQNTNILHGYLTDFINDLPKCKNNYPKLILQNDPLTYAAPLEIDRIINKNKILLKNVYAPATINNSPIYPSIIVSPNVIEIECDKYIILDIRELHRLKSNTDTIDDKFAVIPIDYSKCSTKLNIGTIPTQREIKFFNPPFASLSKLRIAFYRYNGDPLFFNGVNHLLEFNITGLNQSGKYNNINSGTMNN